MLADAVFSLGGAVGDFPISVLDLARPDEGSLPLLSDVLAAIV